VSHCKVSFSLISAQLRTPPFLDKPEAENQGMNLFHNIFYLPKWKRDTKAFGLR